MTEDYQASAVRPWLALVTASSASFLVLLDDSAVALALPTLGLDLDLGLTGLEWVVNLYTLTFAILTLAGGSLVDWFGSRLVLCVGLAAFGIVSTAAAMVADGTALLVLRGLQGASAAFIAPAALALLMTHVPVERRGFALGVWAGVSGSALAAGPLIGALLTEAFGWRSIFLINAPVSGLLVLLALRTLPSWPQPRRRHRLDVKGTITSAIALTAGVFGLTQSNTYGWASLRLWAILAVGAAASILFVRVEGRAANPLVELSPFRLPNFLAANVLALLSLAIMCSLFFFLSLYLQQALQLSAITAGWALLPFTAVIAVIAPLAGWLTDRTGPRALIAIGLLLVALGLLLLSRMDAGTEAGDLVPGLLTTGLGLGLSSAPVTTAALLAVPQRSAGMAAAIVSVSRLIGLAVGVAAMGAIVSLSWPTGVGTTVVERQELAAAFGTGFAVNAILALAGAVAGLFAIRSGPVQPAKSPGVGGQLRGD